VLDPILIISILRSDDSDGNVDDDVDLVSTCGRTAIPPSLLSGSTNAFWMRHRPAHMQRMKTHRGFLHIADNQCQYVSPSFLPTDVFMMKENN
jgi:hypothetical protein